MKITEHTLILFAVILMVQADYNPNLVAAMKLPYRRDEETLFLNKTSENYTSHNLFPKRIAGTSRRRRSISREKLKKFNNTNRNVKNVRFRDAINFESKTKLKDTLSSEISLKTLKNAFHYYTITPREIKQDYPSPDKTEHQFIRSSLSQEKLNALYKSLLAHPFKTWKLKHKFSSMKDIRIHEDKLHEVIHNAKNKRLREKLNKALQGKDVFLDVFGGSNTAGGGVIKEEGSIEGIYPKVIEHWWGKAITPITGSKLKIRQIAMGGTGSQFFQFCFVSYIHEILDIVFLEMAVNDVTTLPSKADTSIPLEQLTRQLLEYPTEPALIYVNVFSGRTCKTSCTNLEDYGLGILSDIYNITSLSWRNAVSCAKKPENNQSMLTACDVICSVDHSHINQLAHAHISLMIINVFRKILLDHTSSAIKNSRSLVSREIKSTRGLSSYAIPSLSGKITGGWEDFTSKDENQFPRKASRQTTKLPPPALIKNLSNIITKPRCWTSLTPNYQKKIIKNNLDVVVTKNQGFYMVKNKRFDETCKPPRQCRNDAYSSWTGYNEGANITISFSIPAHISPGDINSRSVAIAVRTCWLCGAADMWLDNYYRNKTFVQTKLPYGRTKVIILALRVKPGEHTLNIEIVKKGDVSFIGLMVGPPDGPY